MQEGIDYQKAASKTNTAAAIELYGQAIQSFRAATEFAPEQFPGHYLWGVCLAQLSDLSTNAAQSKLLMQQALGRLTLASYHPQATADVFVQLGHLLASRVVGWQSTPAGRKEVLEQADKVLRDGLAHARFSGDTARLQAQLATCHVLLGVGSEDKAYQREQYQEALKMFDAASAVKSMEANAEMYGTWGIALLKLGQLNKDRLMIRNAAERFQSALDTDPSKNEYRYNLACAFTQLNQPDLALRHLRECLEDDPRGIFRASAERDPDLENLRYTEEYKRIMGSSSSSSSRMPAGFGGSLPDLGGPPISDR
jgi:tetratricopeptide (TPR) repeat protein